MGHTVIDRHFLEIEGAEAFEAGGIDPELMRVRAPLMVGVNPAGRAEVVLGCPGVELVQRQRILALFEFDVGKIGGNRDRAPHPAIGTGAAACRPQAVGQAHTKAHRAAMTCAAEAIPVSVHAKPPDSMSHFSALRPWKQRRRQEHKRLDRRRQKEQNMNISG